MSKVSFLIFSTLLLSNTMAAQQVLVHLFFPMGINGDFYGDTLINKREILVKAGIRKVNIRQNPPFNGTTFFSKSYSLDKNGNIDSLQYCFYNSKSDSTFCMKDISHFTSNGSFYEMKMYDSKEKMYSQTIVEQLDKNSAKYTYTSIINGINGDTLVDYKYFNEKGQLVKLIQARKAQEPGYSLYYYNKDGLLDSVSYPSTRLPSTIFSRKYQRKNKVIEVEHPFGRQSWIYNSSGQCVRFLFETKTSAPPPGYQPYLFGNPKAKYIKKMEVFFYYNSNGTLSKITEKTNKANESSVVFSYE